MLFLFIIVMFVSLSMIVMKFLFLLYLFLDVLKDLYCLLGVSSLLILKIICVEGFRMRFGV